jgi:cytoskeletal protein CcmA (bactofilin family)
MAADLSRLGRGVVIRGSIRGEGDIEIEGRVEGVVDVDGDVTLAESARVRIEEGDLAGRRVSIRGAVLGNIRGAAAIVLEEGARVVGDLAAPSIGIRPGGLLRGHVSTGDGSESGVPTRGRAAARVSATRPAVKASPSARAMIAAPPPRAVKSSGRSASTQRVVEEVSDSVPTPRAPSASSQKSRGRAEAPAPVMPSLKKGAKGQLKRKAGR